MTQLPIIDAELLAKLRAGERVEVLNAEGRVIGVVTFAAMTYPEFGMTDAELKARDDNPNAVYLTTSEVIERLQQRLRKVA